MAQMIQLDRLAKRFGPVQAVDGVSFSVERGEVLGFLGPNGAGKSTTMRMLTGYLAPTAGTAAVMGHDVVEAPIEARRKIGYLPEGAPLYGDMTPLAFLRFVAQMRGLRGTTAERAIEAAIERTDLGEVLHRPIETLSKGFKLGRPDNGVIFVSYLGSWLMAGACIAIGACASAWTNNQVIAFVLGAVACFVFMMSGVDLVLAAFRPWAPPLIVDTVASFSFIAHFGQLLKGVIDLSTLLFFGSLIAVYLLVNTLLVDLKKAG